MKSEMKRKETALLDTTREAEELKKRNMMLNTALSSHRHEIRELRAEKAALESLSLKGSSFDDMMREAGGVGSPRSAGARGSVRRSHRVQRLQEENGERISMYMHMYINT